MNNTSKSNLKVFRLTTAALSQYILLRHQLDYLNKHVDLTAISGPDNFSERFKKEYPHLNIVEIDMRRDISIKDDIKSLWSLYKYFKKEKPDIIHSNTPKGSLLSMIAGKLAGVEHRIYNVTGLRYMGATGNKRKLLMAMEKLTCQFASQVVAEGQGVQNVLKQEIYNGDTTIIANGSMTGIDCTHKFNPATVVDADLDAVKKLISYSTNDFIFLAVGRVVKDKGIVELIEAFEKVHKKHPHAKLVLLGPYEGDLDPLPDSALNIMNNHERIIHINWSDDVKSYLSIANVLVHASYREGFPNVILQGAAMECPILCSNILGNNDIVNSEIGDLFELGDMQEMIRLMNDTIENYPKYESKSKTARKTVESLYSFDVVAKSLVSFYQSL